jgi:hypothetical protein
MINKTARSAFDGHIETASNMALEHSLGFEYELGWAAGLVSYALYAGDITHSESTLMHQRIQAVRSRRVALLCRSSRREVA